MSFYDNEQEWLSSLQVGDKVALPSRWGHGQMLSVERLTPTQVILANGSRFRRDTGRQVGNAAGWDVKWIRPVTQDFLDGLERDKLVAWLDHASRTKQSLSIETLRAMKAAYDAATGATND